MKNKIFIFLGLGSIIGLGYYFLQKTKPTISQIQLDDLAKESISLAGGNLTTPTFTTDIDNNENTKSIYTPAQIYSQNTATLETQIMSSECEGLSRTECNKIIASFQNNIVNSSLGLYQNPIYTPIAPIYVSDVSQVQSTTQTETRGTLSNGSTVNYAIGRRG